MNIGIDARWIFPKVSGIGAYTRRLIENLARIDNENQYFIFSNNSELLEKYNLVSKSNVSLAKFQHSANVPIMPGQCRKYSLDVFHEPHFLNPLFISCKLVVTIHDLIPLCFPHFTPKAKKVKLMGLFRYILKKVSGKADKIITISENSKKDLIKSLNIKESKIEVIYNGVSPIYRPMPFEPVKEKFAGIVTEDAQVFLFVGRFDPYKNITGLIKAFSNLKKKGIKNIKLVIVGEDDPRYPEAPEMVKKYGLDKDVIFLGYLEEDELVYWYNRALAFVLPTFYEGFGLPVVEAFACGCPVITSNVASLPEVAADAAILIDPHNEIELTNAMRQILTNSYVREELRQKGFARAQLFSWERTAREVLKVYQKLVM